MLLFVFVLVHQEHKAILRGLNVEGHCWDKCNGTVAY